MKKVIGKKADTSHISKTPMGGKKTMRAANSIMGKEKPMNKTKNK